MDTFIQLGGIALDHETGGWQGGLTTSVRSSGERVVLAVRGELDLATGANLRRLLTALSSSMTSITLDVGALSFIDASGLAVLVEANNRLKRNGGRLWVSHPSAMCEKVLPTTDLAFLLKPFDAELNLDSDHLATSASNSARGQMSSVP